MASILVVDDHPVAREFLVTLLGYAAHRLSEASDGVDGLEVARAERPDLIIVDLLMPTMDGFEFVRRLRQEPGLERTPIIFYTASYVDHEVRDLATACGVSAIIPKPSEPEAVLRIVSEALGLAAPSPTPPIGEEFRLRHHRLIATRLASSGEAVPRLQAMIEMDFELATERDPHRLLESFTATSRKLLGARHAAVGLLSEGGESLRDFVTSGLVAETLSRLGPVPARSGALLRVLEERPTLRLAGAELSPEALGLPAGFPPAHSFLAARVVSLDRVDGWFCLTDKVTQREFSEEDERLAEILAAHVGRSYDNRRLYVEARQRTLELEQEVAERKRAEEERDRLGAQFLQAQKMEAVGRLAGGIAHDFNNLLNVMVGHGELALKELIPQDPLRRRIEAILKAVDRAANLTRQLLAFSRRQVTQPQVLDLNTVLTGLEDMLRRLIGEDVALRVAPAQELCLAFADPGQIEQVILNLAINARDAMPEGGKLTLETSNTVLDEAYAKAHLGVKPGRHAMIAVTDTGVGMDPETQRHVFEPFFTTKETGKGTGLGLATVYGIVQQCGGHVGFYSVLAHGTTFKVYLPRAEGAPEALETRPTGPPTRGSETILLVEDEPEVRELAQEVLAELGYRVLGAADGEEALSHARATPVDLLLTDVVLRGMSGREVAERIRGLRPQARVLFMSGYAEDAIVHHGVLDPGTRFIAKPFSTAELGRRVRAVLDEADPAAGQDADPRPR